MSQELIVKTYTATAIVAPRRIVKFGSNDGEVIQAAAATDLSIGVSDRLGADAANKPCDVIHLGITIVEAGGTITRGAKLTSDASGRAVAAAPAGGTNNPVIGIARQSAVLGDLFEALIIPSTFQG